MKFKALFNIVVDRFKKKKHVRLGYHTRACNYVQMGENKNNQKCTNDENHAFIFKITIKFV